MVTRCLRQGHSAVAEEAAARWCRGRRAHSLTLGREACAVLLMRNSPLGDCLPLHIRDSIILRGSSMKARALVQFITTPASELPSLKRRMVKRVVDVVLMVQ